MDSLLLWYFKDITDFYKHLGELEFFYLFNDTYTIQFKYILLNKSQ